MAKNKKRKSGSRAKSGNALDAVHGDSRGKKCKQEPKPSLAQLLKKHRGVAAKTAPPPAWEVTGGKQRSFLTPQDDVKAFNECLKTSFSGFHYDSPDSLPSSLHRDFETTFGGLEQGGLFLYDVVQPGKKRLTRTSVTRTLVGDPGSTYKYLGLRLFSHPWVDVDENGNEMKRDHSSKALTLRKMGYAERTSSALLNMGNINSKLTERSKAMLQQHTAPHVSPVGMVGSADFNLTLVNKMEPTATKSDLKKETGYGMGKISVGWHRDSGLKDFSSIAVYQSLKDSSPSKSNDSWGVALRAMDGGAGGPLANVPPLKIPLPSGSLYYMLDEFNHNHEHAVIAGSSGVRYSSTHRVAREGQGTWQYIRDKVQTISSAAAAYDLSRGISAISNMPSRKKREKIVSHVRAQQNLMTEIEFEWLRQWFVQGQKHASLHPYWHKPISILCDSFCELEKASWEIMKCLKISSEDGRGVSLVTEDLFDVLIESLTERSKLRTLWKERYQDPIFGSLPLDDRPFPCPCLDRKKDIEGRMPDNLDHIVSQLRHWRSSFIAVENYEEPDATKALLGAKKVKKEQEIQDWITYEFRG